MSSAALPYHEPSIPQILILSSSLLFLNIINFIFDRFIYVGLLGQILLGITYGTPGARWLDPDVERVIVQLGYLGLILLVYEGMTFPFLAIRTMNIADIIIDAAHRRSYNFFPRLESQSMAS
jgi:Kef-type K+ transport system membrane component KefB